jgi:TPR repeat protein
MFENGLGVIVNYGEAVRWYRQAAKRGHAPAQDNLGLMKVRGNGLTQDYAEAVNWFRLAAEPSSTKN